MTRRSGPLISVLLPARNAAATLPACLESVGRQSEGRFECLVIDDGSDDGTAEIAAARARRDPRVVVLRGPRAGLVATLNRGIDAARGAYLARMDADDLMHRERLARQVTALQARPGLAAVGCHVRLFPRAALGEGTREYERWINGIGSDDDVRREAFVECPVAHPTLLARREALSRHRYRDAGWPEDYDLVLRWLEAGLDIGVVTRRLLSWRVGPDSLSRSSGVYAVERFTACKAAFLARSFLRDREEYHLWGHGSTGRALRRELARHGKRPRFIVEVHPGRLGNRIEDAEVVPPERLPSLPRLPLVVSVARAGPRGEVRRWLGRHGWRETVDYVCAA